MSIIHILSLTMATASFSRRSQAMVIPLDLPVEIPAEHSFRWRFPRAVPEQSYFDTEASHILQDDFYQIFTGDTQYYFQCTEDNTNCKKICNGNDHFCKVQQARYANIVQRQSIGSLIKELDKRLNRKPRAIIINGDLTDFGHPQELHALRVQWEAELDGVKMYPGLGNHDIENNVNQCFGNHCAHRMLKWFLDYTETKLDGIRVDYEKSIPSPFYAEYNGSFAYSWNECHSASNSCVHFVQLNNFPTYQNRIVFPMAGWTINSALDWLARDLRRHKAYPTVINFHRYDYRLSKRDRSKLRAVLNQSFVLALIFAHFHSGKGVRESWCLGGRPVPLLYAGSVPANNYLLVRFSGGRIASAHYFHAHRSNATLISSRLFLRTQCRPSSDRLKR